MPSNLCTTPRSPALCWQEEQSTCVVQMCTHRQYHRDITQLEEPYESSNPSSPPGKGLELEQSLEGCRACRHSAKYLIFLPCGCHWCIGA